MEDWLRQELENIGVIKVIPYKPQSITDILKRTDDEGNIAVEVAKMRASIEHDSQNIEALSLILKLNREKWGKSEKIKKEYPALYDYVSQLYDVLDVVIQRNPTTTMMLRVLLRELDADVQDSSDTP